MEEFVLIVGLGNPGPAYAHNRHNIGFRMLDSLAEIYQQTFSRTEHHASTAHGTAEGERVILAKPQTWMNESGKAVGPLSNFYKVTPDRLLVIYDDLDNPLGTVRFRLAEAAEGTAASSPSSSSSASRSFPACAWASDAPREDGPGSLRAAELLHRGRTAPGRNPAADKDVDQSVAQPCPRLPQAGHDLAR